MKVIANALILASLLVVTACGKKDDDQKTSSVPQLKMSDIEGNYVIDWSKVSILLRIKEGKLSMASTTHSQYRCKDDRPFELVDGHILRLEQSENCPALDLTIEKAVSNGLFFSDIDSPLFRTTDGLVESYVSGVYQDDDLLSAELQRFRVDLWTASEAEAYLEEAKAYPDRYQLKFSDRISLAKQGMSKIQNGKFVDLFTPSSDDAYCMVTTWTGLQHNPPDTLKLIEVSGLLFVNENSSWKYSKEKDGESPSRAPSGSSATRSNELGLKTKEITLSCTQSPSKGPIRMEHVQAILGDLITIEEI